MGNLGIRCKWRDPQKVEGSSTQLVAQVADPTPHRRQSLSPAITSSAAKMNAFNEHMFRQRVQQALDQLRLVLDSTRTLALPEDLPHTYSDKFLVTNTISTLVIVAILNLLMEIGLTDTVFESVKQWMQQTEENKSSQISLRFEIHEQCSFDKETTRSVEDPHSLQTSNNFGMTSTLKSFTKITEYHFTFKFKYSIIVYRGVGADPTDRIELISRTASQPIILRAKTSVFPESDVKQFDVNITGFMRHLRATNNEFQFEVNRSHEKCFTPRRNPEVEALLSDVENLYTWCSNVHDHFMHHLFIVHTNYLQSNIRPNLELVSADSVFSPVLPILSSEGDIAMSLTNQDFNSMLGEQRRSFAAKRQQLECAFAAPSPAVVLTSQEVVLVTALDAIMRVSQHYHEAMDYIEAVMMRQLIAAVGKVLSPAEFADYMLFHYRRLFQPQYQPRPLSFAVRRSADHSPEGSFRLEHSTEGKVSEPILTFTKSEVNGSLMQFPLSSSSTVTFGGERHLHLYLGHSFSGSSPTQLNLVAQARQFSSFILMVGRIASATQFDPKYAIILQNKDEVKIPLFLEQIPTAKEFRKAIQSLSPEQQAFASAIRSMQLGGTVFGVLVIQIKPQLERLLNLKPDSLTKEIALGQDLMEMFIRYQIPSDLLSIDGDQGTEGRARIDKVTQHVGVIQNLVLKAKKQEAEEKELHDRVVFGNRNNDTYDPPHKEKREVLRSKSSSTGFASLASSFSSRSIPLPAPSAYSNDMMMSSNALHVQSAPLVLDDGCMDEESDYTPQDVNLSASRQEKSSQDQPQSSPEEVARSSHDATVETGGPAVDFTRIPSQLDDAHDKFDPNSALRATIITASDAWTKTSQKGLLQSPFTSAIDASALEKERTATYDLLDALSRSGASILEDASLHVIVASTHNFDLSLMDTVVQGNINPIERVERSALILASTLHSTPAIQLMKPDQLPRVQSSSPSLFLTGDAST